MMQPLVSIVLPCRNEARYIERCIVSLQASTYPKDRIEIIVVDGMSDDGTRQLLMRAAAHDSRIVLIENPKLTAPAAMNLGIARAAGAVIMRADAHCEYAPDYIPTLVTALDEHGADNVGGITKVVPGADTDVAQAIAIALSHPAAVGNSYFRIGASAPRWVDTVPFGCWKRETFQRIGLFDESLPRNQDDELNMRLRGKGGRILLLPNVVTTYFGRSTLGQLARMFWQYGYYKPLTAMRAGRGLKVRQYVPSVFVLALVVAAAWAPVSEIARGILELVVGSYLIVLMAAGLPAAWRFRPGVGLAVMAALPVMHFAYGLGFLRGVVHFAILKRAPESAVPALSR